MFIVHVQCAVSVTLIYYKYNFFLNIRLICIAFYVYPIYWYNFNTCPFLFVLNSKKQKSPPPAATGILIPLLHRLFFAIHFSLFT